MKRIPKVSYETAEELEARIRSREEEAAKITPGAAKQSILKEIAHLRAYAEAKRWMTASRLKPGN